MGKKRRAELIECQYFVWRLRRRGQFWAADGRGNTPYPGRHSLGTTNYQEAQENLRKLDELRAIDLGLADASILHKEKKNFVTIEEGITAYNNHLGRAPVAGGASKKSIQRYKAVFDKFRKFAKESGLSYWNGMKRHHLEQYANWLEDHDYEYATEFLELTTLKQVVNFLIVSERLPPECRIHMPLAKPDGSNTYCYREVEVAALIRLCKADPALHWMKDVIMVLAFTGTRISEAVSLRASDVDLGNNTITLADERYRRRERRGHARTIKNRRSRVFPILSPLKPSLNKLVTANPTGQLLRGPQGQALRPDFVRICLKRDVLDQLESKFPSGKNEVGFKDGRLHSFRHFFCSLCSHRGVPELTVMDWLGHSSSSMLRRYYHANNEESQRQSRRVDFDWGPDALA